MLSMLRYKAERGGGWFAVIDARNTSQQCSPMQPQGPEGFVGPYPKRCAHCKMEVHRDVNPARNVLKRAGAGQ